MRSFDWGLLFDLGVGVLACWLVALHICLRVAACAVLIVGIVGCLICFRARLVGVTCFGRLVCVRLGCLVAGRRCSCCLRFVGLLAYSVDLSVI